MKRDIKKTQSIKKEYIYLKQRIKTEKTNIEHLLNDESLILMLNLLISAEDHRYRFHFGFDIIAIIRAIRNNVFYRKREGASTIEQQLVRTIIKDFDKSLFRKVKEILLAISLKFICNKKQIALIYLNIAYYGTNLDNLDKILQKYNLKKSDNIDIEICAEIIARLKYPEPKTISENKFNQILNRKRHILNLYKKHTKLKIIRIHE